MRRRRAEVAAGLASITRSPPLRAGDSPREIVLAGGLDASNVAAAIAAVDPWVVDVASGVKAGPGIKDAGKLAAFVTAVRGS